MSSVLTDGLDDDALAVLLDAQQLSADKRVGLAHLLLALQRSPSALARETFNEYGLRVNDLCEWFALDNSPRVVTATPGTSPGAVRDRALSATVLQAVAAAKNLARVAHQPVTPDVLAIGALAVPDPQLDAVLQRHNVNRHQVLAELLRRHHERVGTPESSSPTSSSRPRHHAPTSRRALTTYATNLTERARRHELDPVYGRDAEITRCLEILGRRRKANPVLVGDAGVGKTAVVEGIAQRLADGTVPASLAQCEIFALDVALLFAGTKMRGDAEARVQQLVKEIDENVLLFIDEVHSVAGAGAGYEAATLSELLKPLLARGGLRVIGATTRDEYVRYIESDPALERRFNPVTVTEPNPDAALEMVRAVAKNYEQYHQVRFSDAALQAAVRLSLRYVPDRRLPDKALDLLDETGAASRLQRLHSPSTTDVPTLSDIDVAATLSAATSIPITLDEDERERLRHAEALLSAAVVGQDVAVRALAKALRRRRAGVHTEQRPTSFLCVGPSGVGKTHLARAVSRLLFDSEDLIRIDMSEYQEAHSLSRLLGAPPGYVGHDEPGQLTEALRRRPHSVVLFDEIDKADPKVLDVLLQLLEDGRLTDARGKTVDCSHALVMMTANPPALSSTATPLGFGAAVLDEEAQIANIRKSLRTLYRPEFLNRLDDVLVFRPLSLPDRVAIVRLLLADTEVFLLERQCWLDVNDDAARVLAEYAADPAYGARPLRRAIQSLLVDPLADLILRGELPPHHVVDVTAPDGTLCLSVRPDPTRSVPLHPGGFTPESSSEEGEN